MKMIFAGMFTVLVSLTVAGSSYATEQLPDEMVVAMASSKTICGGNTGRACPGPAPATAPPPVAASPVIPAPKPSPTPVTPTPPASTPAPSTTPTPAPILAPSPTPAVTSHPMVTATLLGQTGEDLVGTMSASPDGIKDVHIKLSGVSGTIKGVRITGPITGSGFDGIWETPANGKNWLVAIRPQADPSVVDLYFDFYKANSSYTITVTFTDGATQAIQAATNTPSSIYLPVATSTPTAPTSPAPAPIPTPATSSTPAPAPTPTVTPTTPSTSTNSSGSLLTSYASDPEGGIGFNTAFWASTINRMVVMFGTAGGGNEYIGDNSVRAFDPVTNTWTYLYTSDPPVGSTGHVGVPNRDNHASFYVPPRDEIWLWGGSHIEALVQPELRFYAGRFSLAGCHPVVFTNCGQWVHRSLGYADMGPGVVKNGLSGFGTNPGCAWSTTANAGMCAFGSINGSPVNDYMIVEPNNSNSICSGAGSGSEPYVACNPAGGTRPPVRDHCQNCMVAAGNDFYVFGGHSNGEPFETAFRRDLWKYTLATHTWTQISDIGFRLDWEVNLTYDSDLNSLVMWIGDKIYVFNLTTRQWSDQTPIGKPCAYNLVGVYAPSARLHVFEGGSLCSNEYNYGLNVGISLSGSGGTIQTPPPAPPPPTNPASTLSAIFRGTSENIDKVGQANQTTPNNTADFHISVSGLRSTPTKVRITSATGGVWETPFNTSTGYWIISTQYSGTTGDFYFEPITTNTFHVKVTYADGTTDEVDASNATGSTPPPPTVTLPTTTPLPTTPPPAGSTCYGGLCMPVKTWITRPLPPNSTGPCTAGIYGDCKEVRSGFNSNDGRVYYFAGDYSGRPSDLNVLIDPYRYWGTTFSYSILNGDWKIEYPNVGIPGDTIMDNIADEVAWVYDSNRNLYYWLGGFGGSCCYGWPLGTMSNGVAYADAPLAFNPVTKKWTKLNFPNTGEEGAVYDPITDAIYQLGDHGLYILHPATGALENLNIPGGLNFGYLGRNSRYDIDVAGRAIYFMNVGNMYTSQADRVTSLGRYNIDARTFDDLGPAPQQDNLITPLTAWDSVSKVFLWWTEWEEPLSTLWIYHPDTKQWEKDAMYQPEGIQPRGNSVIFDPAHNVFMLMGGTNWHLEPNPSYQQYLFLYRYGNGK